MSAVEIEIWERFAMVGFAILFWLTGYGIRFLYKYMHNYLSGSAKSFSSAREWLTVAGWWRWLFGYKPVTGPVLPESFVFQMAGLLVIATFLASSILKITLVRELQIIVYFGSLVLGSLIAKVISSK